MGPRILIADGGGSSIDWRFIDGEGNISQYKSKGWNATTDRSAVLLDILKQDILSQEIIQADEIYYYGAGCATVVNQEKTAAVFATAFPKATAFIASDILGAARALCGDHPGLVAILGTGSNLCVYDGQQISIQSPSLGYLLGDEGSGAYLGKLLIQDFCYGKMPEDLANRFQRKFRMNSDELIQSVYSQEFPNTYLASFTHFIQKFIDSNYCTSLLLRAFRDFASQHVVPNKPAEEGFVYATGSIAFHFSRHLEAALEENGLHLRKVVQSPIAALALYHLDKRDAQKS